MYRVFIQSNSVILLALLTAVMPFAYAVPNYRSVSDDALNAVKHKYGDSARRRVDHWSHMLNKFSRSESINDAAMARFANDYFNRIEWKWDIEHWGVEDYWATPIETLGTHAGDCEDFSIGKYFSLISMGMDANKLRITYVKALDLNLAHMVLAYYPTPSAEPLILDNINKTILPASQRKDLLPIYGFNGDGIWMSKSAKRVASRRNIAKSLPSWGRLTDRMKTELM